MDNSRWKELCNFKKELHKKSEPIPKNPAVKKININRAIFLKIHTNIDDNYEIHSSEHTSMMEIPNDQSDHQRLEETEGYSNPIADLGYKVLTHPSENEENMDEVIEVNEDESVHKQHEKEVPMNDNRGKRKSRERHTVTLGGEGNYSIRDYKLAGLIDCSEESSMESSVDEFQESEQIQDSELNRNYMKLSNRK